MISLRGSRSGRLLPVWLAVVATAVVALTLTSVAAAKRHARPRPKPVGRMYTETNGANGNQVLIFNRYANGKLKRAGAKSTGGKGGLQQQPGCTSMCPILDTQGEVALTKDGSLLFAVNAGSNTITSFRATKKGLKRVSVVSSDGVFPSSLTLNGNVLYALNANSDTIAGFRFSHNGRLTPISGATQPLVGGALPGLPRQIGFDKTGKLLMVTLLANMSGPPPAGGTTDTIDTFPVNAAGVAGPGTANNSTAPFPFAFAFDGSNQAIVAEVHDLTPAANGELASFGLTGSGGLSAIDTAPTNGTAPCWVVITRNGRYAYVVNTGGGSPTGATVSEFKISGGGTLTSLGTTPALPEFAKTDDALSADSRYLYVLSPLESGSSTAPGPNSHIDEYAVRGNGTLRLIGKTASIPIPGVSGLVGR